MYLSDVRIGVKLFMFSTLFFMLMNGFTKAQQYDSLKSLSGYKTDVFFSPGSEQRAAVVAERVDKVIEYYAGLLNFTPKTTILILNPEEWPKYTNFPVYGMPHYTDNKTLIIASEDNAFWQSFIPPLDKIPAELADQIRIVYADSSGNVTMQPFFDLLAIHELGHAFHFQAGINMQRRWMGELFSNIFLHTYIAENEPGQLQALTLFPEMVISGGKEQYKYTKLSDIEERYEEIGSKYPQNYGWYQSRWHHSAVNIYNAGGVESLKRLWTALSEQKEKLDDDALVKLLSDKVHQSAADVMLKWDDF